MWAIKILGPYFDIAVDAIRTKTDFTLETNRKSERKTTEKLFKTLYLTIKIQLFWAKSKNIQIFFLQF